MTSDDSATLTSVMWREEHLWNVSALQRIHLSDHIMRSLHDVHEMKAYRVGHVCLSVRPSVHIIQFENNWTVLD
jgi:hypothetical protein